MSEITSFGEWLRRRRKALDLTQQELANRVGYVRGTIKSIEADARRPSKQLAERLAVVLELGPEECALFLGAARAELAPDQLLPAALSAGPARAAQLHPPSMPLAQLDARHPALSTGTVTFLFTDIAGSTHLWEQFPQTMPAALARHDALLRHVVESHNGVVFKHTGDGLLAVFSHASDALAAAIAAQLGLQAEQWATTGPLPVRMALHTGSAEIREGDYYGPTLNRLARLLTVGHGGQILLSHVTWEVLADALPDDVALRDLGEHRLKDLTRPEQIFQLVAPGLLVDFPPLRTLDARSNSSISWTRRCWLPTCWQPRHV